MYFNGILRTFNNSNSPTVNFYLILFSFFVLTSIIHLSYYLFIFSRFAFYKRNIYIAESQQPVSVIICAKNEAANLRKYLSSILEQSYSGFEVIVVNDAS